MRHVARRDLGYGHVPEAPFEIPLPYGLNVRVEPLTTSAWRQPGRAGGRWRGSCGGPGWHGGRLVLDGLPDLSAEGERDGFYQAQLIRELAILHVTSWTGVELEGGPAPTTPENVAAAMELCPVGERFFQEFTLRQVLLNAAKNGSGPFAAGNSSRAEGPGTAKPAKRKGSPCARGELGADGQLCPYREHALISRQEHEAWDVLLACQGQLRLAPSGHVVGIHLDAELGLAAARGYGISLLLELLPAAEAGLVEAIRAGEGGRTSGLT